MATIEIVPLYLSSHRECVAIVADCLLDCYGLAAESHTPTFDPELAFDASRGQYQSRVLMKLALEHRTDKKHKVLVITGVDLFVPVLTYVFGEAELQGNGAIVSLYRLRNEFFGLPENRNLLNQRLRKEVVHELGHTYGLLHCHQNSCVMHSSTYTEEIDIKTETLCDGCRNILNALSTAAAEGK